MLLDSLRQYVNLHPAVDMFTHNDGVEALLLHLGGTVPVAYQNATYNIPVVLWLPSGFPRDPPIAFVTPTHSMRVAENHPSVSPGGEVSLASLSSWRRGPSAIREALDEMVAVFQSSPPLYSVAARPQPQHPRHPPPPGPTPAPSPRPAGPADPPRAGGGPGAGGAVTAGGYGAARAARPPEPPGGRPLPAMYGLGSYPPPDPAGPPGGRSPYGGSVGGGPGGGAQYGGSVVGGAGGTPPPPGGPGPAGGGAGPGGAPEGGAGAARPGWPATPPVPLFGLGYGDPPPQPPGGGAAPAPAPAGDAARVRAEVEGAFRGVAVGKVTESVRVCVAAAVEAARGEIAALDGEYERLLAEWRGADGKVAELQRERGQLDSAARELGGCAAAMSEWLERHEPLAAAGEEGAASYAPETALDAQLLEAQAEDLALEDALVSRAGGRVRLQRGAAGVAATQGGPPRARLAAPPRPPAGPPGRRAVARRRRGPGVPPEGAAAGHAPVPGTGHRRPGGGGDPGAAAPGRGDRGGLGEGDPAGVGAGAARLLDRVLTRGVARLLGRGLTRGAARILGRGLTRPLAVGVGRPPGERRARRRGGATERLLPPLDLVRIQQCTELG